MSARAVAAAVVDPEMPMLTLDDLGVLRDVRASADAVTVTITPTYSGCPALEAIRDDLRAALTDAGYRSVEVRTVLSPPWSTDWISDAGRAKLAEHGIAPPGRIGPRAAGPIPLTLGRPARAAGRGTRKSCRASAPPPAPRSTAARPAASRSST